jgi:hypothetical protein
VATLKNRDVIPAKAGIHAELPIATAQWIPAFAGMTQINVVGFSVTQTH